MSRAILQLYPALALTSIVWIFHVEAARIAGQSRKTPTAWTAEENSRTHKHAFLLYLVEA